MARTGSAVAVALSGTAAAPRFRARRQIELVPPGLAAQPYHAAAGMDLAAAGELIAQVEAAAEKTAAAGLRTLAATPPATPVRAVAVVVKAVSVPGQLADILRSHAWMHAAEGVLYRQAVLAAATGCGWTACAVEQSALPAAEHAIDMLGQAAGPPWRRLEKDAARAALTLLVLPCCGAGYRPFPPYMRVKISTISRMTTNKNSHAPGKPGKLRASRPAGTATPVSITLLLPSSHKWPGPQCHDTS